jgi:hypothetical protein
MLPTLEATNSKPSKYKKSTKWQKKKKKHFPYNPFRMDFIAFKKFISFII